MPGEPVLIVDDDPMSRKLLRALLAGEGYSIRFAESAGEALTVLKTFTPRLALIDIQLPDIDGLELVRALRDREATRETRIVAVTAYGMKGDQQRALRAGCDGYLTKPFEPASLPTLMRKYLDVQPGADLPKEGSDAPDLQSESRNNLLAEGMDEIPKLLASRSFHTGKARRFLHRWTRVSATLGYPQIASKSRELEELLTQPLVEVRKNLQAGMEELLGCFSSAAAGRESSCAWLREVSGCLAGKRLAMIGFEPTEAERAARALSQTSALTETLDRATPGSSLLANFDLVIVHLRTDGSLDPWNDAEQLEKNTKSLLLIGSCEALFRLDGTTRKDLREFLVAPWNPAELVLRAYRLLSKSCQPRRTGCGTAADAKPVVVIADDDPDVTRLVSVTLEKFRLDCRIAHNGTEALQLVEKLEPSAVILDINLPDMDGFDVQLRMRMEQASRRIPVVLLTGRQGEADVLRAFGYGAADYVTKPFNPIELTARVMRLIDWSH